MIEVDSILETGIFQATDAEPGPELGIDAQGGPTSNSGP